MLAMKFNIFATVQDGYIYPCRSLFHVYVNNSNNTQMHTNTKQNPKTQYPPTITEAALRGNLERNAFPLYPDRHERIFFTGILTPMPVLPLPVLEVSLLAKR